MYQPRPVGSLTPKIYNSGNRIVQGPGWVAFQQEMIHETRVIPTDGGRTPARNVKGVDGEVGRPLGGRYARRGDEDLKPESALRQVSLSEEARMTERFTRRRREHARIQDDGGGPEEVDGAVDVDAAVSAGR